VIKLWSLIVSPACLTPLGYSLAYLSAHLPAWWFNYYSSWWLWRVWNLYLYRFSKLYHFSVFVPIPCIDTIFLYCVIWWWYLLCLLLDTCFIDHLTPAPIMISLNTYHLIHYFLPCDYHISGILSCYHVLHTMTCICSTYVLLNLSCSYYFLNMIIT